MAKALIIIGLIMASIGFSKIANASSTTTITALNDILITANSSQTELAEGICSLQHDKSNDPRVIRKDSSFIVTETKEVNTLLQDLAQEMIISLGGTYNPNKFKSLQDVKDEAARLGGKTELTDDQLLESSKQFKTITKNIIETLGGREISHSSLASFKKELNMLGGVMRASSEQIIDTYRDISIKILSLKSKKTYNVKCENAQAPKTDILALLPFKLTVELEEL